MNDIPYKAIIGLGHTWFRIMDFRFHVTGQHHVPRTGGAVLAVNHISYVDFIMAGYGARWSKRLMRHWEMRFRVATSSVM